MYTSNTWRFKVIIALPLIVILSFATSMTYAADKNGATDTDKIMTEAELQGHVMAFADRYWATLNSVGIEYVENQPSSENSRMILSQLVYSAADAFRIAVGPQPVAAFLDMVVTVTLGRMVFEYRHLG